MEQLAEVARDDGLILEVPLLSLLKGEPSIKGPVMVNHNKTRDE